MREAQANAQYIHSNINFSGALPDDYIVEDESLDYSQIDPKIVDEDQLVDLRKSYESSHSSHSNKIEEEENDEPDHDNPFQSFKVTMDEEMRKIRNHT